MRAPITSVVVLAIAAAVPAAAEDVVLSAFAWHHPGYGGNRWSTETYLTNPTSVPVQVVLGPVLLGSEKVTHPCLAPVEPFSVPPMSSLIVPGQTMAIALGCPDELVGALVFSTDGTIVVASRMVNDRGAAISETAAFTPGFGLELPGVAVSDLPDKGATYMLPAMIWHPNPCGPVLFDTALHFANPNDFDVEVTLRQAAGKPPTMVVNGVVVSMPYTIKVPALGWRQIALGPPPNQLTVCMAPEPFDLFFTVDGPIAVAASVVDRTTQDPRLVTPVATIP